MTFCMFQSSNFMYKLDIYVFNNVGPLCVLSSLRNNGLMTDIIVGSQGTIWYWAGWHIPCICRSICSFKMLTVCVFSDAFIWNILYLRVFSDLIVVKLNMHIAKIGDNRWWCLLCFVISILIIGFIHKAGTIFIIFNVILHSQYFISY